MHKIVVFLHGSKNSTSILQFNLCNDGANAFFKLPTNA